ncbi:hypothetical protein BJF78_17970 [Pseudonocardia sp. CNS-139]|nr:hypothetical protein BJF78_17970 [Pseudonocardia sp. CNS-139]
MTGLGSTGVRVIGALLAGCAICATAAVTTAEPAAAAPAVDVAAPGRHHGGAGAPRPPSTWRPRPVAPAQEPEPDPEAEPPPDDGSGEEWVEPDPGVDDGTDDGTGDGTGDEAGGGAGDGTGDGTGGEAGAGSDGSGAAAPAPDPAAAARQRALEQARQQARAARQARQQAQAAERAARAAATVEQVRRAWETRGRPRQMVIVRSNRFDIVTDGRLSRQAPRRPGVPVTLGTLDRFLPGPWLTIADGKAVLAATVVLTPMTVLDVGGDIRALELVGGPNPADAASIYTGSGRISLHGVSVTSLDPVSQQAVAPGAAGRPFIVVSANGRLDAVDSTISDLGTGPLGMSDGRAGVVFNAGSGGSLVRTALMRNTIGVQLSRSVDVRLEDVTVGRSVTDGLVLRGDRGTQMSGIRAVGNGGNGVVVAGESSDRPVTGISTAENGAYGMAVIGQTGARITGISTASDAAGGLRLNRATDTVVSDFTASEQPTGIFTHVNTNGVRLERVHTTGGRRGLVAEKSTRAMDVVASVFDSARVAGLSVGGQDIDLVDVQVSDARTGVRIERGASDVRVSGLVVNGGQDGIVATPGTRNVVVSNLVANHVEADAVRTFSPQAQILGGRITGGSTGIDIGAATTISGTEIAGADEGIHSRSTEVVHASGSRWTRSPSASTPRRAARSSCATPGCTPWRPCAARWATRASTT